MKKRYPPVWLAAALLTLLLLWKMLGAPLTAEQFGALETPFWQARVLLPARVARVLLLWLPANTAAPNAQTLPEDGMNFDDREMARIQQPNARMINVYMTEENRTVQMPLEGYVCGAAAAEMPAAYHMEALKAQMVAARTRAIYQSEHGGCALHEGADICTDSAHCQGYATLGSCKEKWGNEYDAYRERMMKAAKETADELLTYEGKPITVMYHAMSGGKTEAAQAVFSQSVPYLVSVDSEGEESASGFYTDTILSFEETTQMLNSANLGFSVAAEDVRRSLTIDEYTETGRVESLRLNGREVKATDFRKALGLRSTWFTFSANAQGLTFHQRGYGHGVGMSQVGANSMAADGFDYRAILAHYYPNTQIQNSGTQAE
ncbi:MAG: stage II sporulation protein D [Clostridia bacterium]